MGGDGVDVHAAILKRAIISFMFEDDIRKHLTELGEPFTDGTSSHSAPDFVLTRRKIAIDAKEKLQKFSMTNWRNAPMPQKHLFILDDLAVRRLLLHAPGSFCIIKDSSVSPRAFHVYSIVDLLCMPKTRCRRTISKKITTVKGKWLVDLRNAAGFDSLPKAIDFIFRFQEHYPEIFETHLDCWGDYPVEKIETAGTTRIAPYWEGDSHVGGRKSGR